MKKRGKGLACMFYPIGSTGKPNPASVFLKMNHDGTVVVFIGAVDEGQSSTTALAQIVAEELGIEFSDVKLVTADTQLTPYDHGTGACRVTYVVGNAVKKAANKARGMLLEAAAWKFGLINSEGLTIDNKNVLFKNYPGQTLTIAEAAWVSERERGIPIVVAESFTPNVKKLDPETGQGSPYASYVFATQIAEVEVDTLTGEVDVLKISAVHDCGRAINPSMIEGQIVGGIVMGMGYALMEEIIEDKEHGGIENSSFTDYLIPTALDAPKEMLIDIVEYPDESGPYGAKGVAEPTQLPTAPAIINAIYDAVGARISQLPATPQAVLEALKEKREQELKLDIETSMDI